MGSKPARFPTWESGGVQYPTIADANTGPKRFWKLKPFYDEAALPPIQTLEAI